MSTTTNRNATEHRELKTTSPQTSSAQLARELDRLESTERAARDRRREEEIARLRELARYD